MVLNFFELHNIQSSTMWTDNTGTFRLGDMQGNVAAHRMRGHLQQQCVKAFRRGLKVRAKKRLEFLTRQHFIFSKFSHSPYTLLKFKYFSLAFGSSNFGPISQVEIHTVYSPGFTCEQSLNKTRPPSSSPTVLFVTCPRYSHAISPLLPLSYF